MYITKSFCNIDTLVSNVPGVNSTLGEITNYILTFSREIGKYAKAAYPNLTLYTLYSKSGSGAQAVNQAMTTDQAEKCLAMSNFIATTIAGSSGQIFQDVLEDQLQTFGATIGLVGVVVGAVTQHGAKWGPDFIRFQLGSDTSQEHTIWFSSIAVKAQYTEFEIVVVPPFTPLNNFFLPPSSVNNLLAAITQEQTFDRINVAANGNPPTNIVSRSFNYYNPQNSSQTTPTPWVCLLYGPAADNVDSIKDALDKHILANSTHTRSEWMAILPDIFKRTEFVIVPFWDHYAVEPLTLHPQGVRSPVITVEELLTYVETAAVGYQEAHILANVTMSSFNYTSIGVGIIGNAENRLGKFSILDYYPDYFITSTTSVDFNRMEQATQDWVVEINTMLAHAETMTSISSVPIGYTRVVRNDMVYISKTMNNVAFLVATKAALIAELP